MRSRYAAGLAGLTLGLAVLAPAEAAQAPSPQAGPSPASRDREPVVPLPGAPPEDVADCFTIRLARPGDVRPVPIPLADPVRPGPVPIPVVAPECGGS